MSTVLAHVAAPFAQKENIATEALAFILNGSAAAREALRRRVAEVAGDLPKIARVATQVASAENSRPDLLLLDERGETIGYVEAKFWAALTDAQPVSYIRSLGERGGVLVMLAPDRRLTTLRADVIERCLGKGLAVERGERALVAGTTRIVLVSWSSLLATLRDAVAEDRPRASDIQQLAGLCERFEREGFIPLTREDLDVAMPHRYMMLAGLAYEIVDAADAAGLVSVKGLRATPLYQGPGRYVRFERAGGWLGLNHQWWLTLGRSPLWVWFQPTEWGRAAELELALRHRMTADPPTAYRADDGSVLVPLLLPAGIEKEAVIKDAVGQLRTLDQEMATAGIKPLRAAEPPTEP